MSQKILTEENESSFILPLKEVEMEMDHVEAEKTDKLSSKIENLIGLVTHQIENDIEESRISIPEQTKKLEIIDKNTSSMMKKESEKIDEKKIAEIVKKRKDLEEEMLRLKLEQEEQRNKSRSKSPPESKYHKTFKSKFTTQEQMEISRIIKKTEEFEQKVQLKEKEVLSKIEEEKMRQNQERELYLRELKERKRQESLKKILKIEEEQKSRVENLKNQNKRYQEVKHTKALHEKIEENQKALEELKRLKEEELFREKRRSMTLDAQELKEHERKYYETTRIIKEKIGHQFSERVQKMRENEHLQSETYRPSKFLVTLMNEEKLKEVQERERIEKMKTLFSKKNSFQEKLRLIHKEKIKIKPRPEEPKSIIEIKVEDRKLKAKSLSAADIYKQGQEYMRSAHSSINNLLVEKRKVELQQSYKQLKEGTKTQYKNYLLESRVEREKETKSSTGITYKVKEHNPELNRLEAIIRAKNENENEKLYHAKMIVEKLDHRAKNSSTNAIIDSIAAKLKIIEEFS